MDFNVVVPLGGKMNQYEDEELRYMLRSIDKYFDFEYDVTILADEYHKISWLKNVSYISVNRYYPDHALKTFNGTKHYENFFDTLNKLKITAFNEGLGENILYVYDDILLLKKQDKEQIKTIYAGGRYEDKKVYWDNPRNNKWKNTIHQAITRSKGYGNVFLYETHLPRYYQKSKLQNMFKLYPIEQLDTPYAPSTLYYNMYYRNPDVFYMKHKDDRNNDVKAGFYGTPNNQCDHFESQTKQQVEQAVDGKLWVSYNEAGMTLPFIEWMQKQFPKKSKFEK